MLLSTNYSLSEDISVTRVDNEVVLLNLSSGSYFGLNPVGADFLQDIANNASTQDAIKTLSNKYSIAEAQISSDIEELLAQLLEKGILRADRAPDDL